jgi:beta-glucosidase
MVSADDGERVLIDGRTVVDDWGPHEAKIRTAALDLEAGSHPLVFEYHQDSGRAVAQLGLEPESHAPAAMTGAVELAAVARNADVVVVAIGFGQSGATNSVSTPFTGRWPPAWTRTAGLVEAEDDDRPFSLPPAQIETVRVALAANPRTIVVIDSGGAMDLQAFADRVPAIVWAEYPGEDGGEAIAEVLFGDTNPSGKLPITFGRRLDDYPSSASYNVNNGGKTPYAEGIFVGYRGFEHARRAPMFAFGHGLGYSPFAYADLQAWPSADGGADVRLTVTNEGARPGAEVVQIYVAPPENGTGPVRPPKELKGFARIGLAAGEARRISIALEPRAFASWDPVGKRWAVQGGTYEILAAAASDDVRLRRPIEVAAGTIDP